MNSIDPKMPFRTYLRSSGVSSSQLKDYRRSPAYYRYRKTTSLTDTSAMSFGRAVHCACLTPELLLDDVYICSEGEDFRSKEQRVKKANLISQGKTVLTHTDGMRLHSIRDSLMNRADWRRLLGQAAGVETSVFWQGEGDFLQRRCRPDLFTDEIVVDLKIMSAASQGLDSAIRSALTWEYGNQLAGNAAGLRANGYPNVRTGLLVCVSPTPPHDIFTYMLRFGESQLDQLEVQNQETIQLLAQSIEDGEWPAGNEEWVDVYLRQDEEDLSEINLDGVRRTI